MKRKHKKPQKQCRSKKIATEETMGEKDKQNNHPFTPNTQRNTSGCNWEIFKNVIFNSLSLEANTSDKENVKKKSLSHQKVKKKNHSSVLNVDHVTQNNKEEVDNENKKKLTKQVAMDCEIVGIGDGTESLHSILCQNTSGKKNVKKKSRSNQKVRKKNHSSVLNVDHVTQNNKEEVDNENKKKLTKQVAMDCQNTSGKENVKKKSRSHQKVRKKNHSSVLNGNHVTQNNEEEVSDENKKKLTKQLAMDCEMVGIGDGTESMLARVSIVNRHDFCVYDKYVKPREPVQDYRTKVSGIRPHDLQNGEEFEVVQKEVAEMLRGRILVGHALKHDFDVLYLSHPRKHLRDTSRFKIFRQLSKGNTPSLKKLAHELLGRDIQIGEHSSVEDARAAMQLYVLYRNRWESEFYSKR